MIPATNEALRQPQSAVIGMSYDSRKKADLVTERRVSELAAEVLAKPEIFSAISFFLASNDRGRLTQLNRFAHTEIKQLNEIHKRALDALIPQIDMIPSGNDFSQLLIKLVTSPAIGHPHIWKPTMDHFMDRMIKHYSQIFPTAFPVSILMHKAMAHTLCESSSSIFPGLFNCYCPYLALKGFYQRPWIGFQVLEQYRILEKEIAQNKDMDESIISKIMTENLTKLANERLLPFDSYITKSSVGRIAYQALEIDSTDWFGWSASEDALWIEHPRIPNFILEAIWNRIRLIQESCPDRPLQVSLSRGTIVRGTIAHYPKDFAEELARRIVKAGIFLCYDNEDTKPDNFFSWGISQVNISDQRCENLIAYLRSKNQFVLKK